MTELGYPTSSSEMAARLRYLLSAPNYAALVAEVEGKVVGMIGLTTSRYFEREGSYGRIVALVVEEGQRGKGIGSELVRAGKIWLTKQGARAIYVNSGLHRAQSHDFYQARGYLQTGLRFAKVLAE
jgi:predicted N-acetyltransferase YhbS